MIQRNRPLSPHLTVYRLPLVALMSIAHRASGTTLAVGLIALTAWLLSAASGPAAFAQAHALAVSPLGRLVCVGFTAALFYHLTNGIRHLMWDAGHGYDLHKARRSGWLVLGATAGLTAAVWLLAFLV